MEWAWLMVAFLRALGSELYAYVEELQRNVEKWKQRKEYEEKRADELQRRVDRAAGGSGAE